VMDGFEAARRMRDAPDLADLVIIALSASVFEQDRRRSATAGCQDFIAKPVDAGLLLEKLREHLSLEWVYAEELSPLDTAADRAPGAALAGVPSEEIQFPPAAKLRMLQTLAEAGDIRAIERELTMIDEPAGTYAAFLRRMRELTEEYDMGRIADFLRGGLGPTGAEVKREEQDGKRSV